MWQWFIIEINKLSLDLSLNKYVTVYFLDYLEHWYHIDKKVNVQHVEQDPNGRLHVIHLNYFHFDNWLSNDLVTTINNSMKNRFHSLLCSNIMELNYFHHKHWPMHQVQEESKTNFFFVFFCWNRKIINLQQSLLFDWIELIDVEELNFVYVFENLNELHHWLMSLSLFEVQVNQYMRKSMEFLFTKQKRWIVFFFWFIRRKMNLP